jgi:multidrug resistance protein MdtO
MGRLPAVRVALKLTMAVMTCYFIQSLANWPSIGACVPTCFMVAPGTAGETLHKAALRRHCGFPS